MRTHIEWLKDCHGVLIQVFERFTDICSGTHDDFESGESLQTLFYELSSLHDNLRHEEIEDALEFWAIVYAATYPRLVDGKYASFHEALYQPIREMVESLQHRLKLLPDDWLGLGFELKQRATVFVRYASVFAQHPGLLTREMADVVNYGEGRFLPMAIDVSASDPFHPEDIKSAELVDISKFFEADLKGNRVRYLQDWYSTTRNGALLIHYLIENYPERFSASSKFAKPSDVKKSLPPTVLARLETGPGKGYRLIAPEAPQLRRKLPEFPAQ